jgi:RNA polymerase sigma-70 factor (ECF subfamily)
MDQSDAEAIVSSLEAPAAFGALFDRHATAIHRYLVRRVGPDAAEGLLGDCFRIAFERRAAYDRSRAEARPWLYGIATNLIASHRRSERRRYRAMARIVAARESGLDPAGAVADAVDARQLLPRVLGAIGALGDAERDTLLLHVWEGLSYEDVAVAMAIPAGTVRSRINRARARLRELAGPGGEPAIAAAQGRCEP